MLFDFQSLGCVDILGHVILSDPRERRISLEPMLASNSWRFFVAVVLSEVEGMT
jgi:hypothetical protein